MLKKTVRNLTYKYRIKNIMTTPSSFQAVLENLQKNPFYNKYSERIASLQQTSPDEFIKRMDMQNRILEEKKENKIQSNIKQFSSVLNPKSSIKEDVISGDRKLNDILKIDLINDKSATEIQSIWESYHKNKDVIAAVIPSDLYTKIKDNMMKFPTFILPLPREQGYEFIMCQNNNNTVHCTPLLAFQIHKENAPECLVMVHYTELSDKGIVLMRGDYNKNVLSGKEAQCLANQFQMYYNGKDKRKLGLLETFNTTPDDFSHMLLISDLENIKIM